MIRADMIPYEVVKAAAIERWGINEPTKWELDTCRIIITAALNAWPGMLVDHRDWPECHLMVLPLPQEASDE